MNTLEITLGIISVLSFALAIYSFVSTEIKKANERAKVEIMRERLKFLYNDLSVQFHTADAIVQKAKTHDTKITDLQDIARMIRAQCFKMADSIRRSRTNLDNWRFGKMIPSDLIDDEHLIPKEDEERENSEKKEK